MTEVSKLFCLVLLLTLTRWSLLLLPRCVLTLLICAKLNGVIEMNDLCLDVHR